MAMNKCRNNSLLEETVIVALNAEYGFAPTQKKQEVKEMMPGEGIRIYPEDYPEEYDDDEPSNLTREEQDAKFKAEREAETRASARWYLALSPEEKVKYREEMINTFSFFVGPKSVVIEQVDETLALYESYAKIV